MIENILINLITDYEDNDNNNINDILNDIQNNGSIGGVKVS